MLRQRVADVGAQRHQICQSSHMSRRGGESGAENSRVSSHHCSRSHGFGREEAVPAERYRWRMNFWTR